MKRLLVPLVLLALSTPARAELTASQKAVVAKAQRHEKGGWIYLHVEGGPADRGFQHGYLLAKEIAEALRVERRVIEFRTGMGWAYWTGRARALFVPRIDRENLAEIDGIVAGMKAAGVSTNREEIVAFNGAIELEGYWWPAEKRRLAARSPNLQHEGCSAFIATGDATAGGRVVLGHNTMGGYVNSHFNVVIDIQPSKGRRILMQTSPGWIHSGTDFFITDAGLVGAETTIGAFDGFDPKGIPEFARMRRATQDARTIDEWAAIMRKGNNGGYANAWLIGDVNTGEIARLELGLRYVGFERKRNGWFVGSNVAEDLKVLRLETSDHDLDIRQSNVARRVRWKQLMREHAGKIDLARARAFEADHWDSYLGKEVAGSRTLCSHRETDGNPGDAGNPFSPGGTYDAKVVDSEMAKRMSFQARWGSGCGRRFDAKAFLAAHPQFDWLEGYLGDLPSEPWVDFTAGETR